MTHVLVMPTWRNAAMCAEAIRTLYNYTDFEGRVLLIDNSGTSESALLKSLESYPGLLYYVSPDNLGWMRSINLGWHQFRDVATHFTMCNDDVVFPQDRKFWSRQLALLESNAGVGPTSNYVSGHQYHELHRGDDWGTVPFLIGFCATYRSDVLRELEWDGKILDESLPGGDDLDLSMRITADLGTLAVARESFLFHYGSVTGNRVHSDWDNKQSQLKTANALIAKHGLLNWRSTVMGAWKLWGQYTDSPEKTVQALRHVSAHMAELLKDSAVVVEGSVVPEQVADLARFSGPDTSVLEIGFNAGMSAAAFLSTGARLTSIDTGQWACTEPGVARLSALYPEHFKFVQGDSRNVVLPETRYDLCFIDGGHDYEVALADIRRFTPLSYMVVVDDLQMEPVRRAVETAVAEGTFKVRLERSGGSRQWVIGGAQ